MLALLLATPGEIVLRDELRAHLWGEETFVDFERGLNFCVLQVRAALGDSSDNPRFIQTVPRKGYRFIAPVTVRPGATSVPASDLRPRQRPPSRSAAVDLHPAPPAGGPRGGSRRVGIGALVVLCAAHLAGALRHVRLARPRRHPPRIRVAVLPFTNLTGDAADEYVADGLTDELIAQLGRVSPPRLGVIARTSVAGYRNANKRVADIGRDSRGVPRRQRQARGPTHAGHRAWSTSTTKRKVWADAFERRRGDSMDRRPPWPSASRAR